ncbi:hypothetical protein [Flammeovirga sp. SubArs3]|uniref:hypothetical protein n=1 Tax=Flammeovirga sp. SubArs3 TaxID=2995316 RepID=UPI00248C44CA|nr:hypothetical protein [Flammeovirga sp. SubArs3]
MNIVTRKPKKNSTKVKNTYSKAENINFHLDHRFSSAAFQETNDVFSEFYTNANSYELNRMFR